MLRVAEPRVLNEEDCHGQPIDDSPDPAGTGCRRRRCACVRADDVRASGHVHKDIAPILQRSCQQCHRPDSIAPMSLITYQDARPFAREMKRRVALRDSYGQRGVMPPWFIEKNIGIQSSRKTSR